MNPANLALDTLRTFVTAHDLGGRGHAGARLGRTPSAVSLQMKRLQNDVAVPLFRKDGRGVALTEAGEIVLGYARRILALNDELLDSVRGASLSGRVRVGVSQDFAEAILPGALARFTALYPLVVLEVRIEGNNMMVDALEKGELDVVLAVGQADRPTATVIGETELEWIAGAAFAPRADQPLPIAMLGPQCIFRKEAIARLEAAGRAWRIAAVSPSLAGLWASAQGGLGLTVRSPYGLPAGLVSGPTLFGLPPLPSVPVTLHSRKETSGGHGREAIDRLQAFLSDAVLQLLTARRRPSVLRPKRKPKRPKAKAKAATAVPKRRRGTRRRSS